MDPLTGVMVLAVVAVVLGALVFGGSTLVYFLVEPQQDKAPAPAPQGSVRALPEQQSADRAPGRPDQLDPVDRAA